MSYNVQGLVFHYQLIVAVARCHCLAANVSNKVSAGVSEDDAVRGECALQVDALAIAAACCTPEALAVLVV